MTKENSSGRPFDDTFKTLSEKNSRLMIPVINDCFNQSYSMEEEIELLSGEHHIMINADNEDTKEIITDTAFRIKNRLYHMECQSTPDGTMVLRMVEYDFFIALENAEKTEDGFYEMRFPKSVVLYLRHNSKTPDRQKIRIIFDEGKSIDYEVPIIKIGLYKAEDIIEKELYVLIPYYILRYENIDDKVCFDDIEAEYDRLYAAIQKASDEGTIREYDATNIREFTNKLIRYISEKNKYIAKGAEGIMGGAVLETMADRLIKQGEEREAIGEARGEERGKAIGEERGRILAYHECNMSDEEIANRVGKSIEYIQNIIREG